MRKEISPEFLTNNVILGVRMLSGVWEAWESTCGFWGCISAPRLVQQHLYQLRYLPSLESLGLRF